MKLLNEDTFKKKVRKVRPGVDPTELFFLRFFFFGVKLGHFTINNFFLCATKMQAYQQKTEKFFVSDEKKFGRIDSRIRQLVRPAGPGGNPICKII